MLDHFLSAMYSNERKNQEKRATVDALKKLPAAMLAKLASGEASLSKIACMSDGDGEAHTWLDKFKGTPLMDQAIALEQQELQADVERMQQQAQRREESKALDLIWEQKDQMRIQKKLLELQLYQLQNEGEHAAMAATVDTQKKPPIPEAGNPGNGAMGPESENSEENMAPVGTRGPGDAKTAALVESPLGKLAEQWGRELAQSDMKKSAALPVSGMTGMGRRLMTGAKNVWGALPQAQKTKMLVGAGTGALAGGAAMAHDDQGFHPLKAVGGALGGAALGGALGGVAHNVAEKGLAGGLKQTGQQGANIGSYLAGRAGGKPQLPKG